ncbi:hypothetical protein V5F53_18670 [Xanthobacter sp. V4C-4]|uniref:hypothetical protein n=1 Tax=Xanthobacter cornucopiae TaxID=3119924 RepID=UPI00372B9970
MDKTAGDRTPRGTAYGRKSSEPPLVSEPAAVAAYVAALTEELARLARGSGLVTLSYLLDIARLEARNAVAVDGKGDEDAR